MKHNRIHQRALAIFLSFALVFGILQTAGLSAFAAESGGVTAYYNNSGLFKDSDFQQAVNPTDYSYLQTVTQIEVANSTTAIREYAFSNCHFLTGITLPTSVTKIGEYAFAGCGDLTGISIPASVTEIGEYAFSSCSLLQNVTFGTDSQLGSIGICAFSNCSKLAGITLPARVTSIGNSAFSECGDLTGISIPASVTSIGAYAFYYCGSLKNVTFGAGSQLDSIGTQAFNYCSALPGITLPGSVRSIGDQMFTGCTAMQSIAVGANNTHYSSDGVSLFSQDKTELIACAAGKAGSYQVPDSVTTIDEFAFVGSSLTGISFGTGSSLASVGVEAFMNCKLLTALSLPAGVTSIGNSAFAGCESLKSMALPEGLTSVGDDLFSGCVSLTSLTIPKNVSSIANIYSAFNGCNSLEEINVEQGNAAYCSYDGALYTIGADGAKTLIFCPTAKAGVYTVKAGTTAIGDTAFSHCAKLTDIILPESLKTIGSNSFENCTGLTRIDLPENVTSVDRYPFSGCTDLKELTVSSNTQFVKYEAIPDTTCNLYVIKGTGEDNSPPCSNKFYFTKSDDGSTYQFHSYQGTKVGAVIPTELYGKPISPAIHESDLTVNPVTAYYNGSGFFSDKTCSTPIDSDSLCTVTNVDMSSAAEIGWSAFHGCSSLMDITIPAGVMEIADNAFSDCYSLQNITVDPDNRQFCSHAGALYQMEDSGKLSLLCCPMAHTGKFEIYPGTDTIGTSSFQNCTGLTDVTIPAGVTKIGEDSFLGCSGLTSVTIPAGVTEIGEGAFFDCAGLTSVTIPAGVTEIIDCTFENCTNLKNVTIPSGLTNIENGAFMGCTSLTNITIPSGVTEIGDSAFSGCTGLNTVVLEGAATRLDTNAFSLEPEEALRTALVQEANPDSDTSGSEQNGLSLTAYVPQENLDYYRSAFTDDVLNDTKAEIKAIPVISAFDTPVPVNASKGAALSDLSLPQTLSATVNGVPHTEVDGVTWNADGTYDPNTTGSYSFTAVLPFYYRTAENLSLPKISVHVINTDKSILKFTIGSSAGRIDETADTVAVTVPYGTDVTKLAPAITVSSGAAVSPASGATQDFTKPVVYTVTAQNGGKQAYTVTVTEASAPSSNSTVTPAQPLPSGVTDAVSNAQADLSGATMPAGVTSVTLSVTPEAANGTPATPAAPGAAGGAADPQAAAAFHLAVSDPDLNIIGTPVLYNIKLLDQNGNPITGFSGKVTVKIPVPSGLHGTPHVFRYEESTGKYTDMNAVVVNGFLVFSTEHFSYYTVAGVGNSILLDTKNYSMPVGGKYQIGVKLTGSKAASMKVTSTNGKAASAVRLKNGNVQVTGKGTGTAYIMIDVYDSKNHLLTHASVKIDVKTGIRPRGDSTRQIGVF